LVDFADRPWPLLEESSAAYWIARKQELGPTEGLRMAGELRALVAAQRPDWPGAAERATDLEVPRAGRRVAAPCPCRRSLTSCEALLRSSTSGGCAGMSSARRR
jgi:hypothetical protein